MSLQDDFETDVADVFLDATGGFAESISRYPLGVAADAVTVTADVQFNHQAGYDPQNIDRTSGKAVVLRGRVRVSSSLSIAATDAWLIHGKRYETETIGDDEFGLTTVEIVRMEKEVSSLHGRSIPPR